MNDPLHLTPQAEPTSIQFDRTKNPAFDFDMLRLEEIHARDDLDHSPLHPHRVHFYIILAITSGEATHTIDFQDYDLKSGSILTIRKDQIHHFHHSTAKGYIILFTENYVLSFLEQNSAEKIPKLFNELLFKQHTRLKEGDFQEVMLLVDEISKEYSREVDAHSAGIIRNFLQVMASKIYRIRSTSSSIAIDNKYTSQFINFQEMVERSCAQFRSVQYYADQLSITSRTLNNITNEVIGKSAKNLIDDVLILQIKRMLINTHLTIKEIAYQSGFDEPSNLFKYFKKFTNTTPESFRSDFQISK